MVKTKNANIGQSQNLEEGSSSRGKGKAERVPSGVRVHKVRVPDRFISVKEAATFEEWTRNRRKIVSGHIVNLNDMQGMQVVPNLLEMIGWTPLLTVNELYYVEMIYEFYANLHKGRIERVDNIPHQWLLTRIGGRDIAFDDILLNHIIESPQDGKRFYSKNKKCFDPNLYSERRFEEIFTRVEVFKRHDDRNVNKVDAYGRLLNHMISNIIIPNVGHKSSITNMHSFVMLAIHEHRRMNFGYMAIEHMLATQSFSTKCLPYGCFITKIFQHFVINLVGIGDHICYGKIYNQQTFKRIGFEKNEEGAFIQGGQEEGDDDDEEDDDEDQEGMNVEEEASEEETEAEIQKRETRQKKRQENMEEGSSLVDMDQLMTRIIAMQSQINDRFKDLDGKRSKFDLMNSMTRLWTFKIGFKAILSEAKDLSD
ncbi:hypothetical protein M9H77_07322 [Catharanthus roseus]|uniref:Uncharacterized protein n=1 Tax=Catharanthus roseus TaxID=4058 RepID=A0ACC0BUK7_CATRO|nr:hypothetical protein M9H77_07322 [Catharanthus roseus]